MKKQVSGQLDMYNYKLADIASELDKIDVNELTPIDALNTIVKIKEKLKQEGPKMKCPKCNEEIADGAKFCTKCGVNIEEEKARIAEENEKKQQEEEARKKKLRTEKNQKKSENKKN